MRVVKFKDEITGKFGLKDESGKVIISAEFDDLTVKTDDIVIVKKNGNCGAIDNTGKVVIDIKHEDLRVIEIPEVRGVPTISKYAFAVAKNGKYGIISSNFDEPVYEYDGIKEIKSKEHGFVGVEKSGEWGAVNVLTLNQVVDCKYKDVEFDKNTVYATSKKEKVGAFKRDGKLIAKCEYDDIWSEQKYGLRVVKNGEKQGVIDNSGDEVVKCKYDFVGVGKYYVGSPLGLIEIRKNNDVVYVDTEGKRITKQTYKKQIERDGDLSIDKLWLIMEGNYKEDANKHLFQDDFKDYAIDALLCKLAQFKYELSQAKDMNEALDAHTKYVKEIEDINNFYMECVKMELKDSKHKLDNAEKLLDSVTDQVNKMLEEFTVKKGFNV